MSHEKAIFHPSRDRSLARSRKSVPASRAAVALCAVLGLSGCKRDAPDAASKSDGDPATPSETNVDDGTKVAGVVEGGGPTSADGIMPASQLQRGNVLAHVLMPGTSLFLDEIKKQAAPPSTTMFFDEQMIRTLVSGQLGARSQIAQNIDISKPLGCALVDLTVSEVPVACIVGYKGGTDALVQDLGNEGKQADAAGHAAYYKFSGQDLYLDAVDGHVVLSNHAEVFAKAKDYLQANMIGRADKVVSDVEVVAYMSSLLSRYDNLLRPIIDELTAAQSVNAGSGRFSEAMAKYNAKSTEQMIHRVGDMEQITVGFGLEPTGFVLRYVVFPKAGSRLAEETKASAAGTLQARALHELPKSTWLVAGMAMDWATATKTESALEFRKLMSDAYATAVGKDAAEVARAIDQYVDEMMALYGREVTYALVHEPDTLGALLVSMQLQPGKKGRDQWKAWSEQFTPDNVLDAETRNKLTWSFQHGAYEVEGLPVDRWVIEPTPAGRKDLTNELGPQFDSLEKKLGGFNLVIARAELDDRVLWLVAPTDEQTSMKAAIAAAKGRDSLSGDAGLASILTQSAGLSGVFAMDVKRSADWARAILPPDMASRVPANLGNAFSDVYMATAFGQNGTQTGEFVISQAFLDQLRMLGG